VSFRFRWVVCQLETLRRSAQRNLRGILEKLPKTLDETYERVLKDINEDNRDHARRLLHCLAVAIRPLSVGELAEILAFDFDDTQGGIPKFHAGWRWKDQEEAVLYTCSSLITIVDSHDRYYFKCRVVQFSHFSVKEFLVSDRLASSSAGDVCRYHILPGPAHTILAQACLGFLLHLDTSTDWRIGLRFPLAWYAADHWVAHAQFEDVASHLKDGMQSLFDPDKRHLVAWARVNHTQVDIDRSGFPSTPNPLYYAAFCGFHDIVEHLVISHPQLINTVDGPCDFPVLVALSKKHIPIADMLLRCGGKVDVRGTNGWTALQVLIKSTVIPREDIFDGVSYLLKHGADVNFRGSDLSTPLHTAAFHVNSEVFRLLLESGADIHSRDDKGRTPLHIGRTPLHMIEVDHKSQVPQALDITQLLLDHGANVNARDNDGATPLLVTAFKCYDISQILLERGAEPNAKNNDGQTPLSQLFTFGVETMSLDNDHDESYRCSLARLLLRHGANVNEQDKDHTTPLHLAMAWKVYWMAQILLEHGAEPNVANKDGETPLHRVFQPRYLYVDERVLLATERFLERVLLATERFLLPVLCGYYWNAARM
jgi:ankyrin repeat protein